MVDHEVLSYELLVYNFPDKSLKQYISYLADPKQLITVGDKHSEKLAIGVHQGCDIGQLFFLLLCNIGTVLHSTSFSLKFLIIFNIIPSVCYEIILRGMILYYF